MAFYELRQYKIKRGKMAEWLKLMEGEIIPFQIAKGMVVVGSYRGEDDDTLYFWSRRFNNDRERERLYKAVYEDPYWQNEISPRVAKLINRNASVVKRVVPTKKSNIQ